MKKILFILIIVSFFTFTACNKVIVTKYYSHSGNSKGRVERIIEIESKKDDKKVILEYEIDIKEGQLTFIKGWEDVKKTLFSKKEVSTSYRETFTLHGSGTITLPLKKGVNFISVKTSGDPAKGSFKLKIDGKGISGINITSVSIEEDI